MDFGRESCLPLEPHVNELVRAAIARAVGL